jgi:hypothetical protein
MGKLRAAFLLSFRSKLLIPVLVIMLALVVAITWLVSNRVTAQVEADATRTLETANAVFTNSQAIRTKNLLVRFHAWRTQPQYRAAFQTRDKETVGRFFLQEVKGQQGVDIITLTLPDTGVLARDSRDQLAPLAEFQKASRLAVDKALKDDEECADTVLVGGKLYDVICIPVIGLDSDTSIAVLTIGSEVGHDVVKELSLQTQ